MTPDDLITRLEALEGPCRETDALVNAYCHDWPAKEFQSYAYTVHSNPRVTASLDASIALFEKMLPDWQIASMGEVGVTQGPSGWYACLLDLNNPVDSDDVITHKHAAIALLIAMFKAKALEAKE